MNGGMREMKAGQKAGRSRALIAGKLRCRFCTARAADWDQLECHVRVAHNRQWRAIKAWSTDLRPLPREAA